jgi:exopolysaccharide production protein ExoZ
VNRLRSVQVLRGIAAGGVALMHAHFLGVADPLKPHWTQVGAAGVDLFFVISGFIMATIPKRSPGRFIFDRLWRIYPNWWVALLPWLLLVPVSRLSQVEAVTLWPVTDLLTVPYLSIRWTLSFELLFYAAVAFSIRRGPQVPLALFGLALVLGLVTKAPALRFFGSPMILEFLFGVVVAKLPRSAKVAPVLLIVAACVLCVAPLKLFAGEVALDPPAAVFRVLLWGFPAALILYAALSIETLFRHRAFAPLVVLGDASYSIYLYHLTALKLVAVPWPIAFALAVVFGTAVWWLVERRLLALKSPVAAALERAVGGRRGPADREDGSRNLVLGDAPLELDVEFEVGGLDGVRERARR